MKCHTWDNTLSDDLCEEETLIRNLTDAGMEMEEIERFLSCAHQNQGLAQIKFLREYRKKLLATVQEGQEKLYCLDYLIRKLQKTNQ